MAIQVRTLIEIVASKDADENKCQFKRPNATGSQVIASTDVESSGEAILAASEADYALPMGKVATGSILYLETSGDLTIKLDGEAVGHALKSSGGTLAKLFFATEFTSAPLITNNSSSAEATVSFLIAGAK